MPAATTKNVVSNTRNTLRTDHSIMRSSMSAPLVRLAGNGALHRSGFLFGAAERSQRRLEVALGVDQEVRADHHALAGLDPVQHFDVAVGAHSQLHRARLQCSFTPFAQTPVGPAGGE